MAISAWSISALGVMVAAIAPRISSSPFVHFTISRVQGDSKAAHCPSLPCRPEGLNNQARVKRRANTLISRPTNRLCPRSKTRSTASTSFSTIP
ncbi:hypothetical protein PF008_g22666 [Phytophthora fragariae]|uniref:RxLR effector protein n=1 Tax=Phytophthora fragariae TaxID=53985 RepID=A0A6G0QT03_9STRA|nr:hypothetical protein PF008_g22666 [Phytophthora fragariae]